jgi:fructoselysine-6-P-deglycase FrlB-like protein
MLAEIEQQPEVIARTIAKEGPKIAAFGARLKANPPTADRSGRSWQL